MPAKDAVSTSEDHEIWDARKDELIKKLLIQGNALLNLQRKWSITELRVFSIMLAHVKPHCTGSSFWDPEFRTVFIPMYRVIELFSIGQQRRPHMDRIANAVDKMTSTSIGIRVNQKRHISFPVFEIIDIDMDAGLTAKFSQYMRPYILDLQKKRWTKSPFTEVFQLSKTHAVFLIQWLHSCEPLPFGSADEWDAEISINDLREKFSATSKTYDRVDKLQQRIIVPAINEINARLLFNVTYKPLRQEAGSHRITDFHFHVKRVQIIDAPADEPKSVPSQEQAFDPAEIEPKTGMTYGELAELLEGAGYQADSSVDASSNDDGAIDAEATKPMSDEEQYIRHVVDDCGVAEGVVKKFIKELGWERCKELSDSVEAAGGNAGGIVSAWKNNEPWHAKTKKMATKEPPQKMPIALRNDEMNFA